MVVKETAKDLKEFAKGLVEAIQNGTVLEYLDATPKDIKETFSFENIVDSLSEAFPAGGVAALGAAIPRKLAAEGAGAGIKAGVEAGMQLSKSQWVDAIIRTGSKKIEGMSRDKLMKMTTSGLARILPLENAARFLAKEGAEEVVETVAGKAGKDALNKDALKNVDNKLLDRVVERAFAQFKGDKAKIRKILSGKITSQGLNQIIKDLTPKKINTATLKWLGGATGLATTVAGGDALLNWASLDNVLGQRNLLYRDLASAVKWDGMDPVEAIKLMDEMQENADYAEAKMDQSAKINPFIMLAKSTWQAAKNISNQAADIYYNEVLTAAETTKAQEEGGFSAEDPAVLAGLGEQVKEPRDLMPFHSKSQTTDELAREQSVLAKRFEPGPGKGPSSPPGTVQGLAPQPNTQKKLGFGPL
jgi:hypothetical protein